MCKDSNKIRILKRQNKNYESNDNPTVPLDGFVVEGYDDSAAEEYAKKNNFIFDSLSPVEVYASITNWKRTYTGKTINPAVIVKDNKGNKLVKNVDYTLKYPKNSVNAGSYSIEVKLKGNYQGVEYALYSIVPAKNTMTVKATDKTVSYKTVKNKAVFHIAINVSCN